MTDHLKRAMDDIEYAVRNIHGDEPMARHLRECAMAHALIAIAERLPKRLREEERAQEEALEETRDRVTRGRVRGGTGARGGSE